MRKKSNFYPRNEGAVKPYYDNAVTQLAGALGIKYNTDAATLLVLNGHKKQIPLVVQKAFDDNQQAQNSTAAKNTELANSKIDLMREISRITGLPNWDENDGQLLGIRVEHTGGDPNTAQPVMSKVTALPDQIIIDWIKGEWDGIIIESIDLNQQQKPQDPMQPPMPNPQPPAQPTAADPGWKKIGEDQKSPYEDTRPNKTHNPELRYYRLRYTKNGKAIGLYSNIFSAVAEIYV